MKKVHFQLQQKFYFELEVPIKPNEKLNFDLGLQCIEKQISADDVLLSNKHVLFEVPAYTIKQANRIVTMHGLRPYVCQVVQ